MINRTQFQMQLPGLESRNVDQWARRHQLALDKAEDSALWGGVSHRGTAGTEPIETSSGVHLGDTGTPEGRQEMRDRRYFHGSPNFMNVGDVVEPGHAVSEDNFNLGRNHSVFMDTRRHHASVWAHEGRRSRASQADPFAIGSTDYVEDDDAAAFVYEVEPEGLTQEHDNWVGEFQAKRAKVTRRWQVEEGDEGFDYSEEHELGDDPKELDQLSLRLDRYGA